MELARLGENLMKSVTVTIGDLIDLASSGSLRMRRHLTLFQLDFPENLPSD
jgi:hypothetical protein